MTKPIRNIRLAKSQYLILNNNTIISNMIPQIIILKPIACFVSYFIPNHLLTNLFVSLRTKKRFLGMIKYLKQKSLQHYPN